MEEKQSRVMGFFKRVFLAITDFRLYPFVQREKTKVAVSYFTLLLVMVTIFMSISFSNKILESVSNLLDGYEEKIPEFTLKGGSLDVVERIYDTESEQKLVVDTYMSSEEFANTSIGKEVLYSNSYLVINSDRAIYGTKEGTFVYLFRQIEGDISKETLHEYLTMINEDWSIKAVWVY